MIRNRAGEDTQQSLALKQNLMNKDIAEAKQLKFINKIHVSDRIEDLMKKVPIYITFQLYNLRQ